MAFTRIHHVGIVVSDLAEAKRIWCDIFGFQVDESRSPLPNGRHVAWDNVNILDVPVGESEIEINRANDPNSGTGRYLQRWGPGIHHICLYSTDIDADVERLKRYGLQQLGQTTGSPDQKSGSRVAFFHPRTNMGVLLEVWHNVGNPPPKRGTSPYFSHIHHFGWVVPWSMRNDFLRLMEAYGLEVDSSRSPLPDGRPASDNVRIYDFPIGESEIEVSFPQDEVSGTARYLARRGGPAAHHVCLYAPDIDKAVAHLKAQGLQQIGEVPPPTPGRRQRVGWFHPKSTGGVLLEIWHNVPQ
ncbi:MAG: VOC family protein [Dehalococcoidia bacterium]